MAQAQTLAQLARKNEQKILDQWIAQQLSATTRRADLMKENELREQSREFLKLFIDAVQTESRDIEAPAWKPVKEMLSSISRSRAVQGFSPSETAMFVFSLKEPLFDRAEGRIHTAARTGRLAIDGQPVAGQAWACLRPKCIKKAVNR